LHACKMLLNKRIQCGDGIAHFDKRLVHAVLKDPGGE
jgi:hypothetical protein